MHRWWFRALGLATAFLLMYFATSSGIDVLADPTPTMRPHARHSGERAVFVADVFLPSILVMVASGTLFGTIDILDIGNDGLVRSH